MANTQRRIINKNGMQFIPMNVEGQGYNDNFFNTPKLIATISIFLSLFIIIAYLASSSASFGKWLLFILIWSIATIQILRYIIFEEKFYYRMYKELQGNEITTPAISWQVASFKNTEDGTIMTYVDAKIGVIAKIERDTITGKDRDFQETHYDAISDFYRLIVSSGYSFVQLNMMEPAGKDPRLNELDKITKDCKNDNIKKLVDLQVGYIKQIAQVSLYENDYILIYSKDVTRIDTIIQDTIDMLSKILDGAYIGYKILNQREIIELNKDSFGVRYFDTANASLNIYKNSGSYATKPFNLAGIIWDNGEIQDIDIKQRNKIRVVTTNIITENITTAESLKEQIYVKKKEEESTVSFDKLGEWSNTNNQKHMGIVSLHKNNVISSKSNNINNNVENNQQYNTNQNNNDENYNGKQKLRDLDFDYDDGDDEILDI